MYKLLTDEACYFFLDIGVLALNIKTPEVVQPSVGLDFLQLLQVFMKLIVQTIGQDVAVFSILHIVLSV